MNELPTYLALLRANGRMTGSQLPRSGKRLLQPLLDSGILDIEKSGRGEVILVTNQAAFEKWLPTQFPSYAGHLSHPVGSNRARSVALRRNSKSSGLGVSESVLHLRAFGGRDTSITIDSEVLPVEELTARHGIAACIISDETVIQVPVGVILLIENLECFLQAELIVPDALLALHSAGRVSDRLVASLSRSILVASPLWHLPDYDPVGLSDYLRLHAALGDRVKLYLPENIEALFEQFGDRDLIRKKPRNRALLEQLHGVKWPCDASARAYRLIKESGSGLEQESLLIGSNGQLGDNSGATTKRAN